MRYSLSLNTSHSRHAYANRVQAFKEPTQFTGNILVLSASKEKHSEVQTLKTGSVEKVDSATMWYKIKTGSFCIAERSRYQENRF